MVHIQSGPFSFVFSHSREDDDDGLGMITPYPKDPEELPTNVRTRITLKLLDPSKFEERLGEFRRVPDTFLMFLSQLQRLSLELYQPTDGPKHTIYTKWEAEENGLYTTILTKRERVGKEETTSEQKYYTMKSDLHDLPYDEARKDIRGNSIDHTTVVLAFPVDANDEPLIAQQYAYAFLPLRRVGFSFLIQADFVTQANREDVVHSQRNRAILEGVAKAFVDAVVVFCKQPPLRYRWMRYLPGNSITDDFWGILWTSIREKLEKIPVLESWSGKGLYLPSELDRLSEDLMGEDGTPLLADLEDAEVYLSPKYTEADFQMLRLLKTTRIDWSKFVDRFEADLRKGTGSKWKTKAKNGDWRTRVCNLLAKAFIECDPHEQERLRELALVPMEDGTWKTPASIANSDAHHYFPSIDYKLIPRGLGLDLVSYFALDSVAFADTLSSFGVTTCQPEYVIDLIHRFYKTSESRPRFAFQHIAHIKFLYWFLPADQASLAPHIRFLNQDLVLLKAEEYLYFPSREGVYSPAKLFEKDEQHSGFRVDYLHDEYLESLRPDIIPNGRSWIDWLEKTAKIRRIPEVCLTGRCALSKEFRYLIENRSDDVLGVLKHGWPSYQSQINATLKEELKFCNMLLVNGTKMPLKCTYLPFPKLKKITSELGILDSFPFIAISEPLKDEEQAAWSFLGLLQVGTEANLDFYLCALETFKRLNPVLLTASVRDQLVRIYTNIQSKRFADLDRVR